MPILLSPHLFYLIDKARGRLCHKAATRKQETVDGSRLSFLFSCRIVSCVRLFRSEGVLFALAHLVVTGVEAFDHVGSDVEGGVKVDASVFVEDGVISVSLVVSLDEALD